MKYATCEDCTHRVEHSDTRIGHFLSRKHPFPRPNIDLRAYSCFEEKIKLSEDHSGAIGYGFAYTRWPSACQNNLKQGDD